MQCWQTSTCIPFLLCFKIKMMWTLLHVTCLQDLWVMFEKRAVSLRSHRVFISRDKKIRLNLKWIRLCFPKKSYSSNQTGSDILPTKNNHSKYSLVKISKLKSSAKGTPAILIKFERQHLLSTVKSTWGKRFCTLRCSPLLTDDASTDLIGWWQRIRYEMIGCRWCVGVMWRAGMWIMYGRGVGRAGVR